MLEPHATEIRQELVRVRVAALHHAARRSHAGPLRRAVGNAFVRLGLLLGSDGSVPPSIMQPASSGALADARAPEPIWLRSGHGEFVSELDLAWEAAAPYGIRVGAPLIRRRSRSGFRPVAPSARNRDSRRPERSDAR